MRQTEYGIQLDDIDRKLLELLQADPRTPLVRLGSAVGRSPAAAAKRIHKLERAGVVRGYTALLDPKKTGQGWTAFIHVFVDPAQIGLFTNDTNNNDIRALVADPHVLEAHRVSDDCFILKVRSDHPAVNNSFLQRLRSQSWVTSTVTRGVLASIKEDGFLIEQGDSFE
jgi:Lrp/AsnC family transcriptional regulator, leucine-responsive regulatory protein